MVETIPDPSPSASQKCRSLGQHARDLFILSRYDRYNPLLATFSGVWGTFLAGCSKCEAYPGSITRTDVFQQALLVFISGYIFCGAGMVWNDWVDLSIDRQVARTRLRPLAAGRVTTGEALSWMIVQYITSWLLVAYTLGNQKVQEAMIPITISSLLYPFGKRRFFKVVHVYPQYFLGFTLGYPSLIGWLAIKGQDQPLRESIIESAGLGITVLTWVLYLNTAYSYQDIEGDKKAKVNSIYFLAGSYIRGFLTILAVLCGGKYPGSDVEDCYSSFPIFCCYTREYFIEPSGETAAMAYTPPSAVICGPQTIPPHERCLDLLQTRVTNDPDLKPLLEAILVLPTLLARLQETDPGLRDTSTTPLIDLRNWALGDTGCLEVPDRLPNILLAPLTVLVHIVYYIEHLDGLPVSNAHGCIRESTRHGGFQGFCIGSLSAVALSCSATRADIGLHAATATKLAMCIGAYADSNQDGETGSSLTCCVARCNTPYQREQLDQVLDHYPQVYISAELDESSATITVPKTELPALRDELAAKSILLSNAQLHGRYHSKQNVGGLHNLIQFCKSDPSLHFPARSDLGVSWRNNTTGKVAETAAEPLHEVCLRSILTERARWYLTVSETVKAHISANPNQTVVILEIGEVRCIPSSLAPSLQLQNGSPICLARNDEAETTYDYTYPDNCIAILGAACKYPGAESLEELWELMATARSMHDKTSWRGDDVSGSHTREKSLTGNFVSGVDQFDCAFFGISPREATYMDPQQRIALQVAYRAVESSGYFVTEHKDVGCYLGVGGSDYEHTVNAHSPTAFSFIGTSRAFISGRISHFFNWTGPSITIDTACSSSAVAIHQACRALVSGDCSMALAGGVSIMSSGATHQNLATAGFLNQTDTPCRPFDEAGNGYSRGEGCGVVVLKKLSSALADGDHVLAVIAATATSHSDGCSSITVPVCEPQIRLYRQALCRAEMTPDHISYVEAHGTGTPRGDPVEWHSIFEVFGKRRHERTYVGSIKANIGHTEAASGVAGVLKLLMMLRHERLPPQANFASFNNTIPQEQRHSMSLPVQCLKWHSKFHAACVNNYAAAGNNTVIIMCQAPSGQPTEATERREQAVTRYPVLICGQSTASLYRNCAAIAAFIVRTRPALADVAFSIARCQNRGLCHRVTLEASSLIGLEHALSDRNYLQNRVVSPVRKARPVILVFGGQTTTTIHISKTMYDLSSLLRKHLDHCDSLLQGMGLPSLFPGIFNPAPMLDVVRFHCAFFSIQYACALAWIDSGLVVERVIGHSFGQLTAMCVSGVTTLQDALKLVSGRAELINSAWGSERGAMLSIRADKETVLALVRSQAAEGLDIEVACFNGPSSHVLVGSEEAIEATQGRAPALDLRRLNTSHGFHSRYIDSFLPQYLQLAAEISYRGPKIPIETCSESTSWEVFTPRLVADHSRKPVYFGDAVNRIRQRHGSCIWLDAGSGGGGIRLVKDTLDGSHSDSFHAVHLGAADPMQSLVDTTLQLWKESVTVQFWKYHPIERPYFQRLNLPGYQFDETSLWLSGASTNARISSSLQSSRSLVSLRGLSSPKPHITRFEIDQLASGFTETLRARQIFGKALWPISLYLDLVAQAAALITPSIPWNSQVFQLQNLDIQVPLGAGHIPSLAICLKMHKVCTWQWSIQGQRRGREITYATGRIELHDQRSADPIIGTAHGGLSDDNVRGRCLSDPIVLSATGTIAYRFLEHIVDYDTNYQGIDSVQMTDQEATAQVRIPPASCDWDDRESLNPVLLDQVMLVAELHVMATSKRGRLELFTCTGAKGIIAHKHTSSDARSTWTVFTRRSSMHGHIMHYDIHAFDSAASGAPIFSVQGAKFVKASSETLRRVVERASTESANVEREPEVDREPMELAHYKSPVASFEPVLNFRDTDWSIIAHLVYELTGFPSENITATTSLAEIGIDSLATTDLEHRIKELFGVAIRVSIAEEAGNFGSLIEAIRQAGGFAQAGGRSYSNTPISLDPMKGSSGSLTAAEDISTTSETEQSITHLVEQAADRFAHAREIMGAYRQESGFAGFLEGVFPKQMSLVLAYVVEAFAKLGCDLSLLPPAAALPGFYHLPKYDRLVAYYYKLLSEAGLISPSITGFIRTSKPLAQVDAYSLHRELLDTLPKYRPEHLLLHQTGAQLAECLSGDVDAIRLLFSDGSAGDILHDVYANTPMFKTGNLLLGDFLPQVLASCSQTTGEAFRILELGAGTGGTTRLLLDQLVAQNLQIRYTFTDISPSLVLKARSRFTDYAFMDFLTMNVEHIPPDAFGAYDVVVSSNCIHATKDLQQSCQSLYNLLRPKGMLCLLELTRDVPWLNLTFGLLDGWWRFDDGREHVLADEQLWKQLLSEAGFRYIDWSNDETGESDIFRLILALKE
ncbi:hypothetical protein BDV19DRAFT_395340 [Aspergillus venezuelensis]